MCDCLTELGCTREYGCVTVSQSWVVQESMGACMTVSQSWVVQESMGVCVTVSQSWVVQESMGVCVTGIQYVNCTSHYNAELFREAAGSLQGPLQFPLLHMFVLFIHLTD